MRRFNPRNLALARMIDPVLRSLVRCMDWGDRDAAMADDQIRTIIVFEFFFLGDVVMATPALRALRQRFPAADITLLGPAAASGLDRHLPWIDRMIPFHCPWSAHQYDAATLRGTVRLLRQLRAARWDLAVELRGDLRNILFAYLINARRRVSFAVTGGEYLLTDVVPYDASVLKHQLEGNLEVVRHLGCDVSENFPELVIPPESGREAERYLRGFPRPVIGVHPCSSKANRLWSGGKWVHVIESLVHDSGATVIVLYGPSRQDQDVVSALYRQVRAKEHCHLYSQCLSNTIGLIGQLDLLIAVDSMAGHVAAALQTRFVTLYGPNVPELTRPYHFGGYVILRRGAGCAECGTTCLQGREAWCMNAIETGDVLMAARNLLHARNEGCAAPA